MPKTPAVHDAGCIANARSNEEQDNAQWERRNNVECDSHSSDA